MPERTPGPAVIEKPLGRTAGRASAWGTVDAALILLFAAVGRRTHEHGISVIGILETAWPFLLAYVLTALVSRSWRSPAALWPVALVLWAGTVAGGLAVRALTGAGVALSFQIVTLLVLGALLVLPRAVVLGVGRAVGRRDRRPVA